MSNGYPKHIYEPIRIELAETLIIHEFKKLFSNLSESAINTLKEDVKSWLTNGSAYQFNNERDFWNMVDAIMMDFKLKDLVPYLTAENIEWRKEDIDVMVSKFTAPLFDELDLRDKTGEEIKKYFEENPEIAKREQNISDLNFNKVIKRDSDPVIATYSTDGSIKVLDGNGRLKRAILNDTNKLSAYVGYKKDDNSPANVWIPIGLLMKICRLSTPETEDSVIKLLVDILKNSQSALIEFKVRVLPDDNPLKEKVLSNFEY